MSKLDALRMQIRALEGHHLETDQDNQVLPFEDDRLNAPLSCGGLKLGALHEFRSDGLEAELAPAVTAFAATVAARILRLREGYALWALSRADGYARGFARFGLDLSRLIWVECQKDAEVLGVMEQALHSRALAAVLGEAGAMSLKTGRRLSAAARQSGVTALLLQRPLFKASKAGCAPSGAAATRWRLSSYADPSPSPPPPLPQGERGAGRVHCNGVPSPLAGEGQGEGVKPPAAIVQRDRVPALSQREREQRPGSGAMAGLGPPCWRLDLEYCRNGRTASWIVEALDGSDGDGIQAGHVRVVAELRDDSCEAAAAPARAAARTARAF